MKELEGKVALITGGGEGIGKAACLKLAEEGAKVGVLGRTEENISKVAEQIRKNGGEALVLCADISDPEEMKRAVDELVDAFGRLDFLFANAGINGVWAPIDELEPEEWNKTISINLTGTYHTIKYAFPHMKENGGSIAITSSVNGNRIFSNTGATAYSATKAGQVAMMKMLALEFASHRIRVNSINPGAIESNISDNTKQRDVEREKEPAEFPEGKIPLTDGAPGKAEDVADLVLFLAGPRSKHISGTEIYIDGAESLLQG